MEHQEHHEHPTHDELSAWLRLVLTDSVGNMTARKLLATFGLPSSIFLQSRATLEQVVTERQAQALLTAPDTLAKQIALWIGRAHV